MRFTYSTLLFLFAISSAKAQTKTISATVLDETNRLLHYVYIEDGKYGTIAFTDSVGDFNIKIHPDSKLKFQLSGYRDTIIIAEHITDSGQVILKPVLTIPVETRPLSIHTIYNRDGSLEIARKKVDVVGSRYLSDTFLHGFFNTKNGAKIFSKSYFYNYDKINGTVLICTDSRAVFGITEDEIQSLTMVSNTDELLNFSKVPAIDIAHFVQVLATGHKYSIYKQIKTKYSAANFENSSLGQIVGHDYDEYEDEVSYYVLDVATNKMQEFSIKKSAIRKVFAKDSKKVNDFIGKTSDAIDDTYLINLTNYLND